MLCIPREEGGLAVINLKMHNEALMLKSLHKFFNKLNISSWTNLITLEQAITLGSEPPITVGFGSGSGQLAVTSCKKSELESSMFTLPRATIPVELL
jgi:hypothetical protein